MNSFECRSLSLSLSLCVCVCVSVLNQHYSVPIAAPSANRSGRPSPTCAAHVINDLARRYIDYYDQQGVSVVERKIAHHLDQGLGSGDAAFELGKRHAVSDGVGCVVDGGDCDMGVESTVLDLHHARGPVVLRPGTVTLEQLREYLPNVRKFEVPLSHHHLQPSPPLPARHAKSTQQQELEDDLRQLNNPETPGMKYRHYSPSAEVVLVEWDADLQYMNGELSKVLAQVLHSIAADASVGVIRTHSKLDYIEQLQQQQQQQRIKIIRLGDENHPDQVAHGLFAALRQLDEEEHVSKIIVEGISEAHEGLAVMNRVRKAASRIITKSTQSSDAVTVVAAVAAAAASSSGDGSNGCSNTFL
jgi:L-threonylcarbamoyladenylate synthase